MISYVSWTYPDLLDIGLASGQAQVDVTIATGNRAVFGLAIHSHSRAGDTKQLCNFSCITMRRVTCFNRFTKSSLLSCADIIEMYLCLGFIGK